MNTIKLKEGMFQAYQISSERLLNGSVKNFMPNKIKIASSTYAIIDNGENNILKATIGDWLVEIDGQIHIINNSLFKKIFKKII